MLLFPKRLPLQECTVYPQHHIFFNVLAENIWKVVTNTVLDCKNDSKTFLYNQDEIFRGDLYIDSMLHFGQNKSG